MPPASGFGWLTRTRTSDGPMESILMKVAPPAIFWIDMLLPVGCGPANAAGSAACHPRRAGRIGQHANAGSRNRHGLHGVRGWLNRLRPFMITVTDVACSFTAPAPPPRRPQPHSGGPEPRLAGVAPIRRLGRRRVVDALVVAALVDVGAVGAAEGDPHGDASAGLGRGRGRPGRNGAAAGGAAGRGAAAGGDVGGGRGAVVALAVGLAAAVLVRLLGPALPRRMRRPLLAAGVAGTVAMATGLSLWSWLLLVAGGVAEAILLGPQQSFQCGPTEFIFPESQSSDYRQWCTVGVQTKLS